MNSGMASAGAADAISMNLFSAENTANIASGVNWGEIFQTACDIGSKFNDINQMTGGLVGDAVEGIGDAVESIGEGIADVGESAADIAGEILGFLGDLFG